MQESGFDIRSLRRGQHERWAEQKKLAERERRKQEKEERRLKEIAEIKERQRNHKLKSFLDKLKTYLEDVQNAKDPISFWCSFSTILNTIQEFHSFIQETNSVPVICDIVIGLINAMTQNPFVKINLHGNKWENDQYNKCKVKLDEVMLSLGMDPSIVKHEMEMDITNDADKAKELDRKLNGTRGNRNFNQTIEDDDDFRMALAMSLEDY